jgi:hypothetical protein
MMTQAMRDLPAPYRLIADLLAEVVATDRVPRQGRSLLYDAIDAMAAAEVPEAEFAVAWRVTRAIHALEFAMAHSAAPDRIYARKALKRAQACWSKLLPAPQAGAWEASPRNLAA